MKIVAAQEADDRTVFNAPGVSRQSRAVEMRTVAGPSRHVQCVLSGGPYTVWSQVRHVQVVCPPPWPRQA